MENITASDIAAAITIKTYGLGGAELEDGTPDTKLVIRLGNGQRFSITVRELKGLQS